MFAAIYEEFLSFGWADKVLIVLVVLSLVVAYAYAALCVIRAYRAEIRRRMIRKVNRLCDRLENISLPSYDDDPYDPEWMDHKKYLESKL